MMSFNLKKEPLYCPHALGQLNLKSDRFTNCFKCPWGTMYDNNDTIDPYELMNKRGTVTSALRVENIIIGTRIKIQVKLVEVFYKKLEHVYEKKDYIKKSLLKPEIQIKKPSNRFAPLEVD